MESTVIDDPKGFLRAVRDAAADGWQLKRIMRQTNDGTYWLVEMTRTLNGVYQIEQRTACDIPSAIRAVLAK